MKRSIELLHRSLEEAGRDPNNFGIDPWISIQGLNKEEWHRRVQAWRALGATHAAVDTMRAGFTSPQAAVEKLLARGHAAAVRQRPIGADRRT